jgi:Zn-dependent protease with chaperone function
MPPDAPDASLDDFRDAQRGHRFTARLRAIPAVLAAAAMGIPLSVYLSPVLLALAILVTDLVNFLIPMPDVGGEVSGLIERLLDGDPGTFQAVAWILVVWLVPGIIGLTVAYLLVRWRLGEIGGDGIAAGLGARGPNPDDPEERQLVDVVHELAIAASIHPPRVLLYDEGAANAFVYGRHPDDATVVVGRAMLGELDREATQGAIARLIASASDGDLGLATDIGAVYVTYGLLTTTLSAVVSPAARVRLRSAVRALRGRPAADPRTDPGIAGLLGLPPDDDIPDDTKSGCLVLITMGGLIAVGMSLVNLVLTGPLLVFAWRSRGYLADALAVDLTRNPTALADAVRTLGDGRGLPGTAWLEMLLVVGGASVSSSADPKGGRTLSDTGLAASIAAPVRNRLARLERMGAQRPSGAPPASRSGSRRPSRFLLLLAILIIAPLVALIAVLLVIAAALIVYLVALAAFIILAIVAGPIHELLRGLAGR